LGEFPPTGVGAKHLGCAVICCTARCRPPYPLHPCLNRVKSVADCSSVAGAKRKIIEIGKHAPATSHRRTEAKAWTRSCRPAFHIGVKHSSPLLLCCTPRLTPKPHGATFDQKRQIPIALAAPPPSSPAGSFPAGFRKPAPSPARGIRDLLGAAEVSRPTPPYPE
jgi:hypothetical protein